MKSVVVLGLIAALTFTAAAQQKPAPLQTAEAALGAAIHLEEVERNLDAAIAAYKAFLSRYGSNRPLAARAQYRLGLAYEKRGDAQARQAYERVVNGFSEQKDIVEDAGRRLAALAERKADETTRLRLVYSGNYNHSAVAAAVSPDERWLALESGSFTDGEIVFREIATGRISRRSAGTCLQGSKWCLASWLVFSPDGRQIAYQWGDARARDSELRLIGNDAASKFRVLIRDAQKDLWPVDWSTDGRSILTMAQRPDRSLRELALTSVADGQYRVVKSFDNRGVGHMMRPRLSPDGRFVVYAATPGAQEGTGNASNVETQIYVVATDGSSEVQLTTEGINEIPLWTPDGSHVVFVSNNRSGAFALWAVPLRNGKPSGPALVVRRDTGRTVPIGMTRGGSLYYTQDQTTFISGRAQLQRNEIWAIDNLMAALKAAR